MWEDSANRQGGKWSIQLGRNQRGELDDVWLNTVLLLIGEAFEHTDQICGAVVNVRSKADKISIWTADGTNRAACLDIGRKMKERLNYKGPMYYHMHSDSMVKNSSQVKAAYQV
jgi:translation initiation factor 4E